MGEKSCQPFGLRPKSRLTSSAASTVFSIRSSASSLSSTILARNAHAPHYVRDSRPHASDRRRRREGCRDCERKARALDARSYGAPRMCAGRSDGGRVRAALSFPTPRSSRSCFCSTCRPSPDARSAARLGWWFGLGFFLTGVSWVYVSLHVFGAMPAPLAALATLLFCAYLALFPGLVGYAFRRLPGSLTLRALMLAPALWTLAEWTRGWLLTGFPWLTMGYSQVPSSPLAGYAPVLGIHGVTLATLASAAVVFLIARRVLERRRNDVRQRPGMVPAALIALCLWIGGFALQEVRWTHPSGEPLRSRCYRATSRRRSSGPTKARAVIAGNSEDRPWFFEAMSPTLTRGWAPLRGVLVDRENS